MFPAADQAGGIAVCPRGGPGTPRALVPAAGGPREVSHGQPP